MKKIMMVLVLAMFFILGLLGCSNSTTKDSTNEVTKETTKQDKQAIQNKENSDEKELSDKQKKETSNVKNEVNNAQASSNKGEVKNTQASTGKSQKQEYIRKLNNIKEKLKGLEKKYSGTTGEMKEAAEKEYKTWDAALNEIYSVLESQLPDSEMKQLRQKQRQWISNRDNKAKKDSLEFQGGTMEPLAYVSSLGKSTKERCYELVEKYMK